MKKLVTSIQPSSNPLIGPNARLDGPVFGGNAYRNFPSLNAEINPDASLGDQRARGLIQMLYEGHAISEEVEKDNKKKYARELASHAGKARRSDSLSRLIFEIIRNKPDISQKELMGELQIHPLATEMLLELDEEDGCIFYEEKLGRYTHTRKCSVSALKDRLYRAKKEYRESQLAR